MNKVILIGRLTRDVKTSYTQGTKPLAVGKFSIAVARKYKKQGEADVDFINCVSFGKTAENIGKYFSKGKMISIVGRIQISNYTDNEGKKRTSMNVVVDEFYFIESKGSNENAVSQSQQKPDSTYYTEAVCDDDNLPF